MGPPARWCCLQLFCGKRKMFGARRRCLLREGVGAPRGRQFLCRLRLRVTINRAIVRRKSLLPRELVRGTNLAAARAAPLSLLRSCVVGAVISPQYEPQCTGKPAVHRALQAMGNSRAAVASDRPAAARLRYRTASPSAEMASSDFSSERPSTIDIGSARSLRRP